MALVIEFFVLATTYSCPEGLPSAQVGLTTLFGMGRGVSPPTSHQDEKLKILNFWHETTNVLFFDSLEKPQIQCGDFQIFQ